MSEILSEILNEHGFLKHPDQWDEQVGVAIAEREGLSNLDKMHWRIICYLREYYEEYEIVPTLSRACRVSGEWENSCLSCFFQRDPLKAAKIAGLPEPGGKVKAYYRGICRCRRPLSGASRAHA